MSEADPYHLSRFEDAQARCYQNVVTELKNGRKTSHWMWFIFPQITGLGMSPTSQLYAIKSSNEAKAYLEHPILGARLKECVGQVLNHQTKRTQDIFGYPDYLKFHSSLSLFASVNSEIEIFQNALDVFYGGEYDRKTLEILNDMKFNS